MPSVERFTVEPKYRRANGLAVLGIDTLPPIPDFEARETTAVRLPAGQVAGNHRHPRQEAYICLDAGAELHWVDADGETHIEQMGLDGDQISLFVIRSLVPHAVVNSSDHPITLLGYADGPLADVTPLEVAK
jgi:uncharacterized RmlC-like cupin family protein